MREIFLGILIIVVLIALGMATGLVSVRETTTIEKEFNIK